MTCVAAYAAAQVFVGAAHAQAVPRIKGTVVSFDGQALTVRPTADAQTPSNPDTAQDGASSPDAKADAPLTVGVLPETRYVASQAGSFADMRVNGYVGAVVTLGRSDRLKAQEVYLYDEALRGTGEGRFEEAGRLRINGTLSEVKFTAPQDKSNGTMIVHYRGAVMNSAGRGKTVCEGRAAPPALMSALACAADTAIDLPSGTAVSTLTVGDSTMLVPGAVVTLALAKTPDGRQVTPGVIVDKKSIVEKPQSPQ